MGIFEHSIFMPIIASLMFTVSLFSFLVVFHYSRKNFRLNHSPYLVLLEKNRQLVIKNIGKGSCHNLKGEIVLNGKILDFNQTGFAVPEILSGEEVSIDYKSNPTTWHYFLESCRLSLSYETVFGKDHVKKKRIIREIDWMQVGSEGESELSLMFLKDLESAAKDPDHS
ncbi:MAG: hypothetical protein F4X17_02630 [Gemmatimonadetes bacterium]|nr:hypothetical protein [Gemmatimonadota bacterium]